MYVWIPFCAFFLQYLLYPTFYPQKAIPPDKKLDSSANNILQLEGSEFDISTLPKTRICVLQGTVQHAESDGDLAKFGDYQPMWDVTRGKAGGAQSEEDMNVA